MTILHLIGQLKKSLSVQAEGRRGHDLGAPPGRKSFAAFSLVIARDAEPVRLVACDAEFHAPGVGRIGAGCFHDPIHGGPALAITRSSIGQLQRDSVTAYLHWQHGW